MSYDLNDRGGYPESLRPFCFRVPISELDLVADLDRELTHPSIAQTPSSSCLNAHILSQTLCGWERVIQYDSNLLGQRLRDCDDEGFTRPMYLPVRQRPIEKMPREGILPCCAANCLAGHGLPMNPSAG